MNKRTPIIAVLNDYGTVQEIFSELGAIVLDVEYTSELNLAMANSDAVVFTGGGDISPGQYGYDDTERHAQVYGVSEYRDQMEFAAFKQARRRRLPVLGICRGHQLINVGHGGTLHQHIYEGTDKLHKHEGSQHAVKMRRSSRIGRMLKSGILKDVTSLHHQAVDRLGDGLVPVGWATDGTVEMIETAPGVRPYMLGTQFHPEMDYKSDDYDARTIFKLIFDLATQHSISVGRFSERYAATTELEAYYKVAYTRHLPMTANTPSQVSVAKYLDNISGVVDDTADVLYWQHDDDEDDAYEDWKRRNAVTTSLALNPMSDIDRADAMCVIQTGCQCPLDCLSFGDCAAIASTNQVIKAKRGNPRQGGGK